MINLTAAVFALELMSSSLSPSLPGRLTVVSRSRGSALGHVQQKPATPVATGPTTTAASPSALPADYVIGPEDALTVSYWKEKELSADVVVRPDGMISLPLLNDIQASGLTPEQLRVRVSEAASKYVTEPNVTVVIRQVHSRKVYITGQVTRPGSYPLAGPTTVLQLIATAGGLQEYADREGIVVIRTDKGQQISYKFNYKQVMKRQKLEQNIELKPGDTVVVP